VSSPVRPPTSTPLQLSPAGLTLIAFRDALDAARATLQTAWDARARTLRERETTLFQLYADIGTGIEAPFATIGDRVSATRVDAYCAEIARVRMIKAERAAAIKAKATEIVGLWEELGFAASDDTEQCILRGTLDSLGWVPAVVTRLAQKAETLLAEKAAREERIMVMGQSITALWKRLATPEDEQTAFLEAHAGIGDDVIAAVRAAARCRFASAASCTLNPCRPLFSLHLLAVRKVPSREAGGVRRAARRADHDCTQLNRGALDGDAVFGRRARGGFCAIFRSRECL
jgi:hypothetical protein